MPTPPDWERDGADWPNRDASRFVEAGGLEWHVQTMGRGPTLLLIHGTGASTHSWRDVMPRLARRFTVIAPDLPGHGFTSRASGAGMSLPGMSRLVGDLLTALNVRPGLAVGHSAGAAILVRMALDRCFASRALVGLNGAFLPFEGVLRIFSPAAKLLASTSIAARIAAARARDARAVERLLESTGSTIDARGRELYARLVQSPGHVAGALAMMASWNLDAMPGDLRRLDLPVLLLAGDDDRTIAPGQSDRVGALLKHGRVEHLPGLGHLAHEEQPALVAARIVAFFDDVSAHA